MHRRSGYAEGYSASSSWHRRSPALTLPMFGYASCGFLQRGRPADRGGELTAVLGTRLREIAGGEAVQHLAEVFLGQIFVGILPDQHHRRIHAGAETLDLFPAEIPILREMKGIMMDTALAHLDDIGGAAQPAWGGAADLDMGLLADRLQLEHGVEGRNLKRPNVGHLKQIGDRADRSFRTPAVMLLLHPPQDRDHRRRLTAWRMFGDLLFRPGEVFRREREVRGLQFLWCEAADGHCASVSHCMRRAALAFMALIRFCQNALAVPNTL